jgi:hypothetical protein
VRQLLLVLPFRVFGLAARRLGVATCKVVLWGLAAR